MKLGVGGNASFFQNSKKLQPEAVTRFIDFFAGIGGIRLGLEIAAGSLHLETDCVPVITKIMENLLPKLD